MRFSDAKQGLPFHGKGAATKDSFCFSLLLDFPLELEFEFFVVGLEESKPTRASLFPITAPTPERERKRKKKKVEIIVGILVWVSGDLKNFRGRHATAFSIAYVVGCLLWSFHTRFEVHRTVKSASRRRHALYINIYSGTSHRLGFYNPRTGREALRDDRTNYSRNETSFVRVSFCFCFFSNLCKRIRTLHPIMKSRIKCKITVKSYM